MLKGVIVCVCRQEKKRSAKKRNFAAKLFCDAYTKDKTIKLKKKKKSSTSFSKNFIIIQKYTHGTLKKPKNQKKEKGQGKIEIAKNKRAHT